MSPLSLTHRRGFLVTAAGSVAAAWWASRALAAPAEPKVENGIAWHDVTQRGVEGRGWNDTARFFDRFPAKAEKTVRKPVWDLSRHSAGMLARFETPAKTIHVRYRLLSPSLAMNHMPATGVSGVDLYARDDQGSDRWLSVARPSAQDVSVVLADDIDPPAGGGTRLFTIYLPLYNGVDSLEVGVPEGSKLVPLAPRSEKPIVFYGTSIMQGGCASRPGMAIPAIVGRRLNRPTINLGFSGNGKMEPEVGALLAELDAALFIIDCVPNNSPAEVAEKTEPLVKQLRAARPETPILLVEGRPFANAAFRAATRARQKESGENLRKVFDSLSKAGDKKLHYLVGDLQIGLDGEATVDGSHPTDLGMLRYAEVYEKALRDILRST